MKAIGGSELLDKFLQKLATGKPRSSLDGPYPAAAERILQSLNIEGDFEEISLDVQVSTATLSTTCGTIARFTIRTTNLTEGRIFIIGGLATVGSNVCATNTAHNIGSCCLEYSRSVSGM